MARNILFIQAESLDGRALGYMNEPGAHTPNLDRLAEQGTVFENAYCNSPQCCPSRSSMWAGRYVFEVGAWNNYRGLPRTQRTFVDDLRQAGYQVPVIGRTDHVSGSHSIKARMSAWVRTAPDALFRNGGPRHQLVDKGRRTRQADWDHLDQTTHWLRHERDGDQPFCAYLGLVNTHPGAGYNTSPYWLDKIDADAVALPPRIDENHPVMQRMLETKGCDQHFNDDFIRTCRRHYLAMIAEVDGIVGDLLDTLDDLGLTDNTVVIFNADHGDMRLEHNQYLKNALYEGSARVPMVMAGPDIPQGHRIATPVSLVDMYPTLLDLANAPAPGIAPGTAPGSESGGSRTQAPLTGHSLLPLARGDVSAHPGVAFSEYHSNFQQTGSFMLRQGDWKYIAHVGYTPQLFDLAADPDECNDLSEREPQRVADMDRALRAIVDYEAADAAAKATDFAEFKTWRLAHPGDSWLNALGEIATHWDADIAGRTEAWAERI